MKDLKEIYYTEAVDRYGECCSHKEPGRISLHSNDFDSCYPGKTKDNEHQVCVEILANFSDTGVTFSYLIDTDTYVNSVEYSEILPYPGTKTIKTMHEFWKDFESFINGGSKHAWNNGLLSCNHCGFHFSYEYDMFCSCREPEI